MKKITVKLNLDGGRVENLEIEGRKILGMYQRIDGKLGSTHICVPNFGNELSEYGLPFHGYARNEKWEILEERDNFIKIKYLMESKDSYPTDLEITQTFDFEKKFIHKVGVKNVGERNAPVNIAVHYYFDMPYGWEYLKINGEDVGDIIKKDSEITAKQINEITDGKRIIFMETKNVRSLHLWSGGNQNFCCIEPVMGMRELGKNEEIEMLIELEQKF